jgi:glutamate N-acetyltransferase/amino-acid N-acetyltransferase
VGIKSKRRDLAVIYSKVPCDISAVFTSNLVVAEPVKVSRELARDGRAQAVVVNAGNANACTGDQGRHAAEAMVTTTAEALGIPRELVLVASTGIIGKRFPTDIVLDGIRKTVGKLSDISTASSFVANAILTTDTFSKEAAQRFQVGDKSALLAGVAKGSGMIHPNMGTMLAFLCCDVAIDQQLLDETFREAVDVSFNMITVDGDTSTNDMALVMCNGLAGNQLLTSKDQEGYAEFRDALFKVCTDLAKMIVSDGEGATKFIEYRVINAPSLEDARRIARVVSDSSLVKTALYGRDPNWGRVIGAAGRAGVDFDPDLVDLSIGSSKLYQVARRGKPTNQDLRVVRKEMAHSHLNLVLNLNQGDFNATAWGCDLSEDYVRFNSHYTT